MDAAGRDERHRDVVAERCHLRVEPVAEPHQIGVEQVRAGAQSQMGEIGSERPGAERSLVQHGGDSTPTDQISQMEVAVRNHERNPFQGGQKLEAAPPDLRQLVRHGDG